MGKQKKKINKKASIEQKHEGELTVWQKAEDLTPFFFFGFIICTKIFSLGHFIYKLDFVYLKLLMERASMGGGADVALFNIFGRITYNVFAILFDALIIISYVIRKKPAGKAEGFWERYYPLITVLFPMLGFTYLLFSPYQVGEFLMKFDLPHLFPLTIELTGLIISFVGVTLSIITLWNLKRCFSIMVEVRSLVSTGMYRYIRHPLYMSEIIHAFGTTVLFFHPVSFMIFFITLILEIIRAKFEERKFLKLVPEYQDFKKRTGFLWPKLWHRGD